MIKTEDIIIKANSGCVLVYIPENIVWGKAARLSMYKGEILKEEDFAEIKEDEVIEIDGANYIFYSWTYSDIVEFIIKLHYTYDAQIATILNYQKDPEKYQEKYTEMQSWRNYAKEVASKLIKTE